jgi:hypothetical protein
VHNGDVPGPCQDSRIRKEQEVSPDSLRGTKRKNIPSEERGEIKNFGCIAEKTLFQKKEERNEKKVWIGLGGKLDFGSFSVYFSRHLLGSS